MLINQCMQCKQIIGCKQNKTNGWVKTCKQNKCNKECKTKHHELSHGLCNFCHQDIINRITSR